MSEKDELIITADNGASLVLFTDWLRTTLNPDAPKYPKTGDIVTFKKPYSYFVEAGNHIVEIVEEYEPANNPDEDGRDIRISFVGNKYRGLNGKKIRELI